MPHGSGTTLGIARGATVDNRVSHTKGVRSGEWVNKGVRKRVAALIVYGMR